MSLEQAILDRLEKRNEENARLQNIINDLERSAYASSKQERETYDALVAYIQKMRAQIESDRLEREQMQHQIAELRTERDRILEASRSLVPKSALKQAVLEAAELHGALNDAQGEIQKLRAEVPLESTREELKNAVAKLQEVTTDRDRLQNEIDALNRETQTVRERNGSLNSTLVTIGSCADGYGRTSGETICLFIIRLHDEIARLNAKVGPLEKLYTTIKKHLDHGIFFSSGAGIYDAVAETAKELSQLTA